MYSRFAAKSDDPLRDRKRSFFNPAAAGSCQIGYVSTWICALLAPGRRQAIGFRSFLLAKSTKSIRIVGSGAI
jgi:hypothetical protein